MKIAYWSRGVLRGYGGASTPMSPELDGRITVHQGHFANPLDHSKGPLDFLYSTARYLVSSIALLAWLGKSRVDVIHQHVINLDVLPLLAFKRLLGYRLALTFHGMDLDMAAGS